MSFVSHDLICENGHGMPQEVYRRSEGPPPCEHCGAPTRIGWFSGAAPGFTGFGTMNIDGKEMSTGDFESYRRNLEANNPGKRVKVESYTDRQVDQRIDERKQRPSVVISRRRRSRPLEPRSSRPPTPTKRLREVNHGSLPRRQAAQEPEEG
jgi:hypothetical protein